MFGIFRSLPWSMRIAITLIVISALMSLGLSVANAQTVPGKMVLKWTLPTTGCTPGVTPCDNALLNSADALTAVEVYISTTPDMDTLPPTLTLAANATTTTHTMQVAAGSTMYARLKAVNTAAKSAFTDPVSKLIVLPVVPGMPTDVTIELQIMLQ